jgi:hypothetical protein
MQMEKGGHQLPNSKVATGTEDDDRAGLDHFLALIQAAN